VVGDDPLGAGLERVDPLAEGAPHRGQVARRTIVARRDTDVAQVWAAPVSSMKPIPRWTWGKAANPAPGPRHWLMELRFVMATVRVIGGLAHPHRSVTPSGTIELVIQGESVLPRSGLATRR
jgi:hypothetical protein